MNKKEKKDFISKSIDLSNGRFKDSEVDTLYDLVKNINKYDGKSGIYRRKYDGFSSDGKYTRIEEITHTIKSFEGKVKIERNDRYHDDDGDSWEEHKEYTTGRDILNNLWKVLKK